jgi:hypothetical protein
MPSKRPPLPAPRPLPSALCVAAFLLFVFGCGQRHDRDVQYHDKIVGTWDTSIRDNPRFVIKRDGTGTRIVKGKSTPMTWRLNRVNLVFTIEGKKFDGNIKSISDSQITINDPGLALDYVFTRVRD